MEIKLPEGTPDNIKRAYTESVRILDEANTTANTSSKKYVKSLKKSIRGVSHSFNRLICMI